MNRKGVLLFVLLVAVLTALAIFDSFRNPLLTFSTPAGAPVSSATDQSFTHSYKPMADFMSGGDEYMHMVVPGDACARVNGINQVFCLQGYFAMANGNMLRKVKPEEGLRLDKELPTLPKNPGILRHVWYSSLGIAVATLALDPTEYSKYIDAKYIPQFAEGWAFFAFSLYGANETTKRCDFDFQNSGREACYFGMGQAAFFNRGELSNIQYSAEHLAPGFLFLQSLVDLEADAKTEKKSSMSKVAKVIGDLWEGKSDSTKSDLAKCLESSHPVECSKYY